MQLYLIRHAQSENNSKPEAERVEDPGITQLGHQQAMAVAGWVAPLQVDYLVTSAFRRTLETTRYVASGLATQPHIWRDLHEVGGCYRGFISGKEEGRPGMTYNEIKERFPEFKIDPLIGSRGWWESKPYESNKQASQRARRTIEKFIEWFGDSDKTIVAVVHADFMVCLFREMLGTDFTNQHIGPMLNTGICKFNYRENSWRLDLLNSVSHLRPALIR